MLKIANLGAIYKNQTKDTSNSGIEKSIKSSSEKAGNERDTDKLGTQNYDLDTIDFKTSDYNFGTNSPGRSFGQEVLFAKSTFNDVRDFSSRRTSTSFPPESVNNVWTKTSSAQDSGTVIASNTNGNFLKTGSYDNSVVNFHNSSNQIGLNHFDRSQNSNRSFNIPNDGKVDPLYDSSKHSKEENDKISKMMTIMNSSSSSEVSNADSANGEKFTKAFTDSILSGKSLQETIKSLDGKDLGPQTSVAYNTDDMGKEISKDNKANGTAIILRGSNDGVEPMMDIDEKNVTKAYEALGLDVKVVHSEKEFEKALLDAREKAISDKTEGKESVLATHVISHGTLAGSAGNGQKNNAGDEGALAMQGGGLYREKDIIGDIAGALEDDKDGESPFTKSFNSFTACHSGALDNKEALAQNNGQETKQPTANAENDAKEKELVS